jgi:hypothetical protein
MFKLKLSIWLRPSASYGAIGVFLGTAHDHKSFAAMEAAVRSGCFGPMSKTRYFSEYVDPVSGVSVSPLFDKISGRMTAVLPFAVSSNWIDISRDESIREFEINHVLARKRIATEWKLFPFKWVALDARK